MKVDKNYTMFVLTRYLYIADDVKISLLVSILEKDCEKAMFWASEMHYSGYEEEVLEFVCAIYSTFFQKWNPRFKTMLDRTIQENKNGSIHALLTIIKNLTAKVRHYSVKEFVYGKHAEFNNREIVSQRETRLWIQIRPELCKKYAQCRPISNTKHDKFLPEVCLYSIEKRWGKFFECSYISIPQKELLENHRKHWLYYASFTPLWRERILKFGGEIGDSQIVFPDDDSFEEFHNRYDYELDEQAKEVQGKVSHIEPYQMCDANEFYKKYEPGLKVIKSKRVNKKSGKSK